MTTWLNVCSIYRTFRLFKDSFCLIECVVLLSVYHFHLSLASPAELVRSTFPVNASLKALSTAYRTASLNLLFPRSPVCASSCFISISELFPLHRYLVCFHTGCSKHSTRQLLLYFTSNYGNLQTFNSIIMVFALVCGAKPECLK